MFEKGDIVLFGINGICEITDVRTLDISGVDKNKLYYILHSRDNNCTIYISVDGDLSKMRKLISKENALKLIENIRQIDPLILKDDKKPDLEYKEVLNKYDCSELIKLIKCIYLRKKKRLEEGKKAMAVDEKYMNIAEDVLYQELGTVLNIPKDEVLDFILNKVQ